MATKEEYKKAIEKSNGTNTSISKILGNTPQAVTLYRDKNTDIDELIKKKRLELIDKAENVGADLLEFYDGINPSQAASIRLRESQYVRSRLGKDKGWVEKQQIEHSGDLHPTEIQIIMPNETTNKTNNQTGKGLVKAKRRKD